MRGIGCDIIEINRVKQACERHKQAFLDRILTQDEQAYCLQKKEWAPYVAARFAAKEAIAKALGCGIGQHLNWLDIEISRQETGQPQVTLSPEKAKDFGHPHILLSISHCKEYAMATVLIA